MHNRFFTESMLEVLLSPERWQLISSHFTPDISPFDHHRRQVWSRRHTHGHEHQEVLLALQGEGFYGYRGKVYPLHPGTVIYFDAHEEHDSGYPSQQEGAHLWISILHDRYVARLLRDKGTGFVVIGEWTYPFTQEEADIPANLFSVSRLAGPDESESLKRTHLRAALSLLVCAVIRAGYTTPAHDEQDAFHQQIVTTIQLYLEQTAGKGVTLDTVARIAGYSKYHFTRIFSRYTGQSIHQYIDRCRLKRVRELHSQGFSKKEIAGALGFSCQSAFSRWYRENH
ncbi:MAG: helix-turn-helix transcriptional regulator [Armatimonadota bacterium]